MRSVEIELSDPQADIVESTAQRNLMHCGVGSGKTHCIGLISADFARNNPEVRGFLGANTYGQLNKSTLNGVFKVWQDHCGWIRDVHYVSNVTPPSHFKTYGPRLDKYDHTISFANGALIFTASLDNYKVIDGTEFAWACLDETKDTKEEAVREVIVARMRQQGMWITPSGLLVKEAVPGATGFNPLYIFTSPAKTDWLAEWFEISEFYEEITAHIFSKTDYFRKRKGDKLIVISSTYHNEANLSEGFIQRLIDDNAGNDHRIAMLVYGSPLAKTGGEYFSRFERMKHVREIPLREELPIHISFDFNRNPYITATCFQVWFNPEVSRYTVYKFREFCLEAPDNYTEALCSHILTELGQMMRRGLFIYGDYSGKNARTNSNEDDYDVIYRVLAQYIGSYSDKVIVNQGLTKRHDFMNKVLAGGTPIDYYQSPDCKTSILEYEYLREDPNGGKFKQMVKNPLTGISYQKYGHIADADEYFFTSAFEQFYNN